MTVNPKTPSKSVDPQERVKFLHLTARVRVEEVFLAQLADALENGREVVVLKDDNTELRFKRA